MRPSKRVWDLMPRRVPVQVQTRRHLDRMDSAGHPVRQHATNVSVRSERQYSMDIHVHPAIEPLAFLLGTWHGTGNGDYPTIEPFAYEETVTFEQFGKPFIAYTQRTMGAEGAPLHTETGYIRAADDGALELVISQPSGITEIHTGTRDHSRLEFMSDSVSLSPTAKRIDRVGRVIDVDDDTMTNELMMAAVGESYQWHLGATLHRI